MIHAYINNVSRMCIPRVKGSALLASCGVASVGNDPRIYVVFLQIYLIFIVNHCADQF